MTNFFFESQTLHEVQRVEIALSLIFIKPISITSFLFRNRKVADFARQMTHFKFPTRVAHVFLAIRFF